MVWGVSFGWLLTSSPENEMSDFTIDTSLPVDASDEEARVAHNEAMAEAAAATEDCPTCGEELSINPSDRVEHAKETGHPAY